MFNLSPNAAWQLGVLAIFSMVTILGVGVLFGIVYLIKWVFLG